MSLFSDWERQRLARRAQLIALALALVNLFIVTLIALPAYAQPEVVGPHVGDGLSSLVKEGVLGSLVVVEGGIIYLLFRSLQAQHQEFLKLAIEQTKVFADVSSAIRDLERMVGDARTASEKVLDHVR